MAWSSLLFLTSIRGLHEKTSRNLTTHVIGSIFLFLHPDVIKPRGTTEEPTEHIFGAARIKEKEFAVRGFCQIISATEIFFGSMFRSGLNPGTRNGNGYCTGLIAFAEATAKHGHDGGEESVGDRHTRILKERTIAEIVSNAATIDSSSSHSVAAQIAVKVLPLINETTRRLSSLFDLLNVPIEQRSRFHKRYDTLESLLVTLEGFFSAEADDVNPNTCIDSGDDDDVDQDDIVMRQLANEMNKSMRIDGGDTAHIEAAELAEMRALAKAAADKQREAGPKQAHEADYHAFMRLLDLIGEDAIDLQDVVAGVASCLDGLSSGRARGKRAGAIRQTHNSLIGRFFTPDRTPSPPILSDGLVHRGRLFETTDGSMVVLTCFKRSGSRFTMTKELPWPAKPGKKRKGKHGKQLPALKTARVHCSCVQFSPFDGRVSLVTPIKVFNVYVEDIVSLGSIIKFD